MLFTRTHSCRFPIPKQDLKNRLIGNHVKIHNLDFEVFEEDQKLRIIPHAEQEEAIKTLPITDVEMREEGNTTKLIITSKMREFDAGGPMLIMVFCTFMFAAAMVLFFLKVEPVVMYILLGMSVFIFSVFCIRLQMGYFDYVRKVREYVKNKAEGIDTTTASVNAPVLTA
jgi:hypothetical protein